MIVRGTYIVQTEDPSLPVLHIQYPTPKQTEIKKLKVKKGPKIRLIYKNPLIILKITKIPFLLTIDIVNYNRKCEITHLFLRDFL